MRCQRCQGYMISDYFMDLLNVSGEMDFKGWRCLNCGDITDPVIMRHHQSGASAPAKSRRRWWGGSLSYVSACEKSAQPESDGSPVRFYR